MTLRFNRMAPHIGAEVTGIDLAQPVSAAELDAIEEALYAHKVLFFREGVADTRQFRDFVARFGQPDSLDRATQFASGSPVSLHPEFTDVICIAYNDKAIAKENFWHYDISTSMTPPSFVALRSLHIPPVGGDTLFADMAAAYEGLSERMKAKLEPLNAMHDIIPQRRLLRARGATPEQLAQWDSICPLLERPVIGQHPVTGEKILDVNETYTQYICGMETDASDALLQQLFRRYWMPEYQCRFRWNAGAIALWDNRGCQHYATQDYAPHPRSMQRMSVLAARRSSTQET